MKRHLLPLLLLSALALPLGATAGELFRCTGKSGETVYSSTRAGYGNCKTIRAPEPKASRAAAAVGSVAAPAVQAQAGTVPAADGKRVEFRTAAGSAAPKAVAAPASATVNRGAVYRYTRDGVVHYTNRRPADGAAKVLFTYIETCFACGAAPGVNWNGVALNTAAYSLEIAQAAAEHGIDEALVRAVIHAESAFRKDAVSRVGAQGLMQLMPATAERFGVADAFQPAENIRGGTKYLAWLLKRFKGDVRLATAGYNAGEGAVDKYSGVPPYQETQRYVERVAVLHERYRGALGGSTLVSAGSP